jgi:hypothetical protein
MFFTLDVLFRNTADMLIKLHPVGDVGEGDSEGGNNKKLSNKLKY